MLLRVAIRLDNNDAPEQFELLVAQKSGGLVIEREVQITTT